MKIKHVLLGAGLTGFYTDDKIGNSEEVRQWTASSIAASH